MIQHDCMGFLKNPYTLLIMAELAKAWKLLCMEASHPVKTKQNGIELLKCV